MDRRSDPFFDVPKKLVWISQGQIELPVCYFDASNYLALFRVDAAKAADKLRGVPVEPIFVSGRAVVVLSFYKYRDTTLGPYREVGLAVLAVPEGERREFGSFTDLMEPSCGESLGAWVLDLPVTTPLAKAAGCEVWGYPKFLAQLPIELEGDHFRARVAEPDGKLIMELSGQRGYPLPDELPGMALLTYSMHQGRLLRTKVATRSRSRTSGGGSIELAIGDSEHRMAKDLRDLGLAGRTPKLLQTREDFQSLLFAGEPV